MMRLLVVILLVALTSPIVQADDVLKDKIFEYDNAAKAQLKTKQPLIVVCGATWCGPCVVYKAGAVTAVAKDIKAGKLKMHLAYVDVDKQPKLKAKIFGEDKFGVPYTAIYTPRKDGTFKKTFFYGEATAQFVIKTAREALKSSK